jgi:fluoride exporter
MEPPTSETTAATHPSEAAASDEQIPLDSDPADADAGTLGEARTRRPVHLHPGFVLAVIAGGTVGALARYGLSSVLPSPGGWPLPTLVINLAGAFFLGILLEALVRRGPDAGRLRIIRLVAGTGFMGAFTTYSTLALETNTLIGAGRATDALVYVAATLLGGAVATVAGIQSAAGHHTRMTVRRRDTTLRPEEPGGSL